MGVTNPYIPAIVRTVLPEENTGVSRKKKVKYILFFLLMASIFYILKQGRLYTSVYMFITQEHSDMASFVASKALAYEMSYDNKCILWIMVKAYLSCQF